MLISFGCENFSSFKNRNHLSLEAYTRLRSHKEHFISLKNNYILKSSVIYGANASGKTNLLQALMVLKIFLTRGDPKRKSFLPHMPFLLEVGKEKEPTILFATFYVSKLNKTLYYEVSSDSKAILSERLLDVGSSKNLFFRQKGKKLYIDNQLFPEGQNIKNLDILSSDVSLLSLSALLKGKIASSIIEFFETITFFRLSGPSLSQHMREDHLIKDSNYKNTIEMLLKGADIGVCGLSANKLNKETEKQQEDDYEIKLRHYIFDKKGNNHGDREFSEDMESTGTVNYYRIAKRITRKIKSGGVLCVDELENSLHSILLKRILDLVNSEGNTTAQLIFTTHNTSLLNNDVFRKDQVYFTEKNNLGFSEVFSLLDFTAETRPDFNWEKRYLEGIYGAIPILK